MKVNPVFVNGIKREIVFYIGKNKEENFEVIDKGNENDLWFHAKNESSCHVVCNVPENILKNELKYIIKVGALLCKNNTSKLKSISNVEIIYTQVKNIEKTNIIGCVTTKNTKTITC